MPYKAFVSSTFKDLRAYRRKVLEALRASGFIVDPMEDWTADRQAPKTISQQRVEGCDLCILLVAYRRGHVPAGEQDSITQMEYRAAVRLGLDVLVFMLRDNADWPQAHNDLESDPGIGQWRGELMENLTVAFFDADPASIPIYPALNRWLQEKMLAAQGTADLQEVLQKAIVLLRQNQSSTPPQPAASHAELALARYVVRREYFGSLIYDRIHDDYIAFDHEAITLFELSRTTALADIYKNFVAAQHERQAFETFVQLCQNIGLLDEKGRFTGVFLGKDYSTGEQLSAPVKVYLALTKACNLHCHHCYLSAGKPYAGELDTATICKLLDEMAELGCYQIGMGGGEPLLRADLPDILDHASARGISVTLSTNATLVTPELAETLDGCRISAFRVSLDAAHAALYDTLRGQEGAFEAALQGIRRLRALGTPIILHTVLMKPNVDEIPALLQLAEQLGAEKLILHTLMPTGRAASNPDLCLGREEINRMWEQAGKLSSSSHVQLEISGRVPGQRKWLFSGFGCDCGHVICHIDARGRISPTGFLHKQLSGGSIRHFSLKQLWDSDASLARFRQFRSNASCNACEHFTACRGGCRARALLMENSLDAPDGACAIAYSGRKD